MKIIIEKIEIYVKIVTTIFEKKKHNNNNKEKIQAVNSVNKTNNNKMKKVVVDSVNNNNNRTLIIGFSICCKTYLVNHILHQEKEPMFIITKSVNHYPNIKAQT